MHAYHIVKFTLPIIRELPDLSTSYLTSHSQITVPILHNYPTYPQITPPFIYKLSYQSYTNYQTRPQIALPIIHSGIAIISMVSKGV